jgi:hypothetical protein
MSNEMCRRTVGAIAILLLSGATAAAQVPDTARYTESVRAVVTTTSGASRRERRIVRDARYTMVRRADTTVVTADTIALAETGGGGTRVIDVDAVIGGKWRIVHDGGWRVTERPVVPPDVTEISDLGVAMDDFLPPPPPTIAPGAGTRVGQREWSRQADSSGARRFRWTLRTARDTLRTVGDSVPMASDELTQERGAMTWSPGRGALGWRREVRTTVTTRLRGRVVRAEVEQVIEVRRDS